jgi:RNA polymerase sigma factor (sigma-70 family)
MSSNAVNQVVGRRRKGRGARVEELEQVYERRLAEFRRLAEAVTGDPDSALDTVQEAFARAVRLRESFAERGSLDAWVWRIVLNVARDHAVARSRSAQPVPLVPVGPSEAREGTERVRAAVAALPERQRAVLFLRYYADLDYGSIAEVLAISPGTVGATLNAARRRLRSLLEEVA